MSSSTRSSVPSLAVFQGRLDVALRTWSGGRCPCTRQRGQNHMVFRVPSTPNDSMVLWLSKAVGPSDILRALCCSSFHGWPSSARSPHFQSIKAAGSCTGIILLTQPDRQCHEPAWRMLLLCTARKIKQVRNSLRDYCHKKNIFLGQQVMKIKSQKFY